LKNVFDGTGIAKGSKKLIRTLTKKNSKVSPGNAFQNKKLKEVERLAGDQVNVWIKSALGKLQSEYRTDVLKFGEKYRIQYPREWEKVKGKWDELFAEADITYDVDINIDNFGSSGRKK